MAEKIPPHAFPLRTSGTLDTGPPYSWTRDKGVARGQVLADLLRKEGLSEDRITALIEEGEEYDGSVSDMMLLDDLGPRRATTRQLRTIINEGIKAGFNRRYRDTEKVPALDPNGVHALIPIVVHRFIDQVPAPQHIRCRVLIKTVTKAEPTEVILDVHEKSIRRLTPAKPKRSPKPDPTWEHVLDWYVDLVETTQTNPATVDFTDGTTRYDGLPVPIDLLQPTDPWFMTADMVTLVSAAAEGMPSAAPHISDLVTTSGFCVLEEPFFVDTVQWGIVPVRALVWKLTGTQGIKGWPGSGVFSEPIVACMALMDLDHPDSTDDITHIDEYRARLWPVMHWLWPEGQPVDAVYDWENVPDDVQLQCLVTLRKFFMAMWLLSGQRIAGVTGQKPVRGLRRRAERLKLPSTVLVVRLRRETGREYDHDADPQQIEWSHRWLVTGHWRRIWDKKEQRVRLTWVSPYIKGPDEKPLIIKDRIVKFER
jgi:hypothetical protein